VAVLTIRIDVDDDGEDDARFPLKWAVLIGAAVLSACGLGQLVI
jgi:hypothetical protein